MSEQEQKTAYKFVDLSEILGDDGGKLGDLIRSIIGHAAEALPADTEPMARSPRRLLATMYMLAESFVTPEDLEKVVASAGLWEGEPFRNKHLAAYAMSLTSYLVGKEMDEGAKSITALAQIVDRLKEVGEWQDDDDNGFKVLDRLVARYGAALTALAATKQGMRLLVADQASDVDWYRDELAKLLAKLDGDES